MKIKFFDKDVWSEVVDFNSFIKVIVDFVKSVLKFEFGFDLDAEEAAE